MFGVTPYDANALHLFERFALDMYYTVLERHPEQFPVLGSTSSITKDAIGFTPERVLRAVHGERGGSAPPSQLADFAQALKIARELPLNQYGRVHLPPPTFQEARDISAACETYLDTVRNADPLASESVQELTDLADLLSHEHNSPWVPTARDLVGW